MKIFLTVSVVWFLIVYNNLNAQTPKWEFMGLAGEEIYDIAVDDSGNIFVASWTGVFKSTDNGVSWAFKNNGLQIARTVKLFIDYEGNIYLCGFASFPVYGLYKSSDGGENWIEIADTLNGNPENYFYDVVVIPNEPGGIIYVSNHYGIYRSTDNGITWQSTNYSNPCASNIGINTNGYMFFGNACASWFGIYRSTDLGLNWVRHTFLSVELSMVYLRDGSVLAGCYDPGLGNSGIYKTTNNGDNWFNTNTFTGINVSTDFLLDKNNDIYVSISGQNPGIYLSTDNGNSWMNYGLSGQIANSVTCLSVDTSGYVWAGAHLDGVYRAEGRTVPVELASFSAEVNGNNVLLSWITASEINNRGFEIERSQKSKVKSQNSWQIIGFVDGNGTTTEIKTYSFIDENVSNGLYLYRLKQIDFDGGFEYSNAIEVIVETPNDYYLSQNYPNPFNPETTIKYSLKENGIVSLKVYNILGSEVAELVNERKSAGEYSVSFDFSDLASGTYFYILRVNNFVDVKKMVLIK